ncbi:hypothetical protein FRB91_004852 [Serendipita sp. 411]|nr:hypothetical protein FRC18_002354 [Serendipita sp. 400]KAG8815218.1 hypothetical protein FRC19_001178 [Serendipita sp. 401]KAG8842042.1 hypothetical protein FRC20_004667 [Serendipita sp. 405]KAG8860068.1 hypothetical protein FRB91_004852 [Serendipita sp. 411]KAG9020185.1 hypothetical protein FS842_007532 [Serendipita sp. 407]
MLCGSFPPIPPVIALIRRQVPTLNPLEHAYMVLQIKVPNVASRHDYDDNYHQAYDGDWHAPIQPSNQDLGNSFDSFEAPNSNDILDENESDELASFARELLGLDIDPAAM